MTKKQRILNRRNFIGTSIGGLAGISLFSGQAQAANSAVSQTPDNSVPPLVRTLGKTGIKIPVVSMGVMNADNPALLRRSYELGVRHFDTAQVYQRGRNEEMVGKVIDELKVRSDVVIATKMVIPAERLSAAEARKAVLDKIATSLKRLRTDYIDILYLHNVKEKAAILNPGIIQGMKMLKERGLIRHTGFSTHSNMHELISEAVKNGDYEVILTAYNYAMHNDSALQAVMKKASQAGIGLIAMKTQCQQPWYRQYESSAAQAYYEGGIIHSALLKWVMRHTFITTAVPGYTNFEQLEQDMAVSRSLQYSAKEEKFLRDRGIRLAMSGVCTQCSTCVSSCSARVDIPALIRVHMYAAAYGNLSHAVQTLREIPPDQSLQICSQCSECRATCVNNVDIRGRISELLGWYA